MERRNFLKQAAIIVSSVTPVVSSAVSRDEAFLLNYIGEPIPKVKRKKIITSSKGHFDTSGTKKLHLVNVHTEEEIHITFRKNGQLVASATKEFNHFMRDFRTGEVIKIDPHVLDMLYAVSDRLDTDRAIHVLSGYRSKATNDKLRRRMHGVAQNSLHTNGRAIDIAISNRSVKKVAKVGRLLKYGGVGQYNKSHFVHLDTGRVRHWYG